MKILSISDVITNSSNEVFIMSGNDAKYYDNLENTDGCVSIQLIDLDWILNAWEIEAVIDICNLDKSEVCTFVENQTNKEHWWDDIYKGKRGHWEDPTPEDWKTFCELHKDAIDELVSEELYFVDIEDHFENAYDVIESARSDALWSDNRH